MYYNYKHIVYGEHLKKKNQVYVVYITFFLSKSDNSIYKIRRHINILWSTKIPRIRRVSVSGTCCVRHWHTITLNYMIFSNNQRCRCPYPCFIVNILWRYNRTTCWIQRGPKCVGHVWSFNIFPQGLVISTESLYHCFCKHSCNVCYSCMPCKKLLNLRI